MPSYSLLQNVRYAFRSLLKRPGFSLVVLVTSRSESVPTPRFSVSSKR
jgi:hypothetical protein